MGKTTDELIRLAHEVSAHPHPREYDMLVSTGERISNALCAMAIHDLGHEAVSFTGSQAGIVTDGSHTKAKIVEVRAQRIHAALEEDKIVLVAGFQGVSTSTNDVTTLGRGGSDTTAVALAAALGADACEIFTDVAGVFTADPRIVPTALKLSQVTYEEMLEMSASGAKVMALRSIEVARSYGVKLRVRSTFVDGEGTWIGEEDEVMLEKAIISGVTHDTSEAKVSIIGIPDRPGVAAKVFRDLARAGVNVDMIVQNVSQDGAATITFTLRDAAAVLEAEAAGGRQQDGAVEALGAPPGLGEGEVLPLRVGFKDGALEPGVGGKPLGLHACLRRERAAELPGEARDRAAGEEAALGGAHNQLPFRVKVGPQALVALKVVLREVRPEQRVGAEMPELLRLERAHLADRGCLRHAPVLLGGEAREGKADVARRARLGAGAAEGVRQELRQRCLAIRARDGHHAAAPEQGREVDLRHADAARLPGQLKPGVVQREPRGEDDQLVSARRLPVELHSVAVIDHGVRPEPRQEGAGAAAAHAGAQDGNRPVQARAEEVWSFEGHGSTSGSSGCRARRGRR